jgi:transcriptional regulator with XRE-family HTH domain
MKSAASIVRTARREAGLTQKELADRMGTTQSAVARLEAKGANPRLKTLEKAVRATGRNLEIDAPAFPSGSIDESLTARYVRATPAVRLRSFVRSYESVRELALAAARSRGRLA